MVLGADGAGVIEQLGEGTSRFAVGDDLLGQLLIPPLGSAGTYAEYVGVTEDAPPAPVPDGLDDVVAAALPTAGGTGSALVSLLEPLADKTMLIAGAGVRGPRASHRPMRGAAGARRTGRRAVDDWTMPTGWYDGTVEDVGEARSTGQSPEHVDTPGPQSVPM
jgi:hypothetical protein